MLTPTKMIRKASFSKLINMAVSISVEYSYGPVDTELYNTKQDREQARKNMFNSLILNRIGVITWLKFCLELMIAKSFIMDPILDHGNMEQFEEFLRTAV